MLECLLIWDTAIETLLLENTQFDFGHIQPTTVLGGVMKLQFPGDPARLCRRKRLVQRGRLMGVEMVQHHAHHDGFWVALVYQPLHFIGEVELGPLLRHMHVPPAGLRFDKEKKIARAVALVFVIKALRLPWLGRQRLPGLFDALLARLLKVDLGTFGILRLRVHLQHVFHRGDKLGAHVRDAPLLLQPRLEVVFFHPRRTLS